MGENTVSKYTMSELTLDNISRSTVVYISGQMSGLEDLGMNEMQSAEDALRAGGFISILNPYKMVDQTKKLEWHECMTIDIRDIMNHNVKMVVLLDNWTNSKGATLEVILFLALGIPLFNKYGQNVTTHTLEMLSPAFIHGMFNKMVDTHRVK